jgi:hypothetical protein
VAFYHEKRPFLVILSDFGLFSHLWLFYHEWAAFYHEKRPFLAILSDLGIFSHLWLFIMNGRLFITKKKTPECIGGFVT